MGATAKQQPAADPVRFQLLDLHGDHVCWLHVPTFIEAPRVLCWQRRYYVRMSHLRAVLGGDQYRETEVWDAPKTNDAE